MPSSVETFSVTKFLPGELTIIFASVIFTRTQSAQLDTAKNIISFAAQPRLLCRGRNSTHGRAVVFVPRSRADSLSRKSVVFECLCRMEAGARGLTWPSQQALTASALRASGTIARISRAFKIWRIDILIARRGTSE